MKRKIVLTLAVIVLLACLALTLCACSLFGGKDGADGKGIKSITLTSENGLEKTYTITFTDDTKTTFVVTDGADGTNGQNGINGKSAYDIAVEHGFDGTEQQWLDSLKGQSGEDTSGYTFEYNGTGYTFTGIGDSNNPNVVIPSTYKGKPVTAIKYEALHEKTWVTSVTIPEGVTSIGAGAFYDCNSLTSVTFAEGSKLTSIGECAFDGCSSLTSITIPEGVTYIDSYGAFENCYHLVEVYNKSSLNITAGSTGNGWVGYYAKNVYKEAGGSKLSTDEDGYIIYTDGKAKILVGYTGTGTALTLPAGITEINQYAFYGCSSLTSITIPDSVTSIGSSAFYGCSSLETITLPFVGNTLDGTSNTHFGYIFGASYSSDNASYVPTSLKTVVITKATGIGSYAFEYCSSLTSVTFAEGSKLTSIGNYAFSGCISLTSITIPDSVTSIGSYAFYYCSSLTEINYGGTMAQWKAISKGSYWNDYTGVYTVHCADGNV